MVKFAGDITGEFQTDARCEMRLQGGQQQPDASELFESAVCVRRVCVCVCVLEVYLNVGRSLRMPAREAKKKKPYSDGSIDAFVTAGQQP